MYLYTMGFYSAMKKNRILSFASKWMEVENIILREVSQAQKTNNHVFPHMWTLHHDISFLLSLIFSLQKTQRRRGWNRFCLAAGRGVGREEGEVAQTMYTHVSVHEYT
jgi:hypothetical protein